LRLVRLAILHVYLAMLVRSKIQKVRAAAKGVNMVTFKMRLEDQIARYAEKERTQHSRDQSNVSNVHLELIVTKQVSPPLTNV
jgi:hypothetical protein